MVCRLLTVYPFPKRQILDSSKFKQFADNNSKFDENGIKFSNRENKRAMMALNRSPESVSPQNEFYLLYYYCSNL